MSYRRLAASLLIVLACGLLLWGVRAGPPVVTTNPPSTTTVAPLLSSPDGPVPTQARATVSRGTLSIDITVSPVDVGTIRMVAVVRARGALVTDAQVQLRLSMPAQPGFGAATLPAGRCGNGYCGQGQLQALGRWHIEVLVRRAGLPDRSGTIPFDLLDGANARFLFVQPPDTRYGPATVSLSRTSDSSSLLRIHLRPGLTVRAMGAMPDMASMGTAVYAATPATPGLYIISLAFAMTGVESLTLQVRDGSGWRPVRTLLYDVDSKGGAVLLTNTPT